MKKAIWNGQVIAESDNTEIIDCNHYFLADSIKQEFFLVSDTRTICPWKGEASYYNIEVDGKKMQMQHGITQILNPRQLILKTLSHLEGC